MLELQKPPRLHKGDKLAALSLSWGGAAAYPERYALGKKRFESFFEVQLVEGRHALRDPAWLAANPKARADDLMEAFADPSVKGIISIIGGDDSIRLEPYVDLNVIRSNPKIFMGYSDTTISHFMCLKAGLSSFYGPSLLAEFAENVACFSYTIDSVRRTLFENAPLGLIEPEREAWTGQMLPWDNPENSRIKRRTYKPAGPQLLQGRGCVRGPLIGGCVEVLEVLRGTPLWPSPDVWEGAILFLDVSEENPSPDYFRRWVRGYASMGILDKLNGLLLGRPMCEPDSDRMTAYDRVLQEVVRDECEKPDLLLMTQMDFGHSDPKFVIPYGALAEIDCGKGTITLPASVTR